MKHSINRADTYGIGYLLVACLLIIVMYVILWRGIYQGRPEMVTRHFEKELRAKSRLAEKYLSEFLAIDTGGERQYGGDKYREILEQLRETGLTLYVYNGDSLTWWSDNSVPIPRFSFREDTSGTPLIRMETGWYRTFRANAGETKIVGLLLIKNEYPFQNTYLRDHYAKGFCSFDSVRISTRPGAWNVTDNGRKFLCSLSITGSSGPGGNPIATTILFFAACGFFLLFLYKSYAGLEQRTGWNNLVAWGFPADVLILRIIQYVLRWPGSLYEGELFSHGLFYANSWFPSLGDLLIDAILVLACALVFFKTWKLRMTGDTKKMQHRWTGIIAIPALAGGVVFTLWITSSLVTDSSIPLDLRNIASLDPFSLLALSVIALLWVSLFLVASRLAGEFRQAPKDQAKGSSAAGLPSVLLFLIITSLATMVVMNISNTRVESEKRKIVAMKLAAGRNPVTEVLFGQVREKILADDLVDRYFSSSDDSLPQKIAKDLPSYLMRTYFGETWNNYNLQVTLCSPANMLRVQPQGYLVSCADYFGRQVRDFGRATGTEDLYYLDFGYGEENYLAMIQLPGSTRKIYIELSSKLASQDLGYPELLVDEKLTDMPDLSDYSYGFYRQGQLVQRVGKYAYGFSLYPYLLHAKGNTFFNMEGMNHYYYPINKENILLVSRPVEPFMTIISPFSYLFIFFALFLLLFNAVFRTGSLGSFSMATLRNRLQVSVLGIILTSFIIVGIVQMIFLVRLNTEKNKENLMERALSILVEMQHKFGMSDDLAQTENGELENTLVKFSNVFFTDINIYQPDGRLLASSRPQVFEEGLKSNLMDRTAIDFLSNTKASQFVQEENIGSHTYYSAYMPMYNNDNRLVAYINLPYFSRQADLKREISSFLVAFVNIYVLFILLGVFTALMISRYVTKSLKMLAARIGRLQLGRSNEKIEWKRKDEVGILVEEYNRKLDELAESAEKLAASERESAWREMARQVAHEIKNPLTPMKLSTQYLQKAWEEKAGDWDQRLKRYTEALIAQIDSLSAIAGEFSDFAKMPPPSNEVLDLDELLQSAVSLYHDIYHIPVRLNPLSGKNAIFADRKQILRVLTNLLNNAVQAIGEDPRGEITITVETHDNMYHINIHDNGEGIGEEQAGRIFQPNFTTKSGGMGLGLAIVREIIRSQGGEVTFSSEPGKGTTFTVMLPATKL